MTHTEYFNVDGAPHRVRGLQPDSGTFIAGKTGYRKWKLEHKTGDRWYEDGYVVLPNDATTTDARKRWRV